MKYPLVKAIFSVVLILTNTTTVMAATSITGEERSIFDITSKVFIDGNLLANPRLITRSDETASITIIIKESEILKMDLIAKDIPTSANKKDIHMKFKVEYQRNNETMRFTPTFIVSPNQKGQIKISSAEHSCEMHVLARRE